VRPIDLSHTVEHGAITYKGLPGPVICDFLSREASRANTPTYVDSSFYRYASGKDLAQLHLESPAHLDAVVVAPERRAIVRETVDGLNVRGRAVLEHMRNLDNLPGSGFRFSAVPVKVSGFGTFPVRAYAVVED
jgi:kynurenine formamidase